MRISPDQLPDETQALKQIIAAMAQDAIAAQAEIAKLRFQLARYRRAEFGRSSEKLAREAEQLELAIEALEADQAERLASTSPVVAAAIESAVEARKPARRPLPEHLPREDVIHSAPCTCPTCGGALRRSGEEITETLDYVPGRFKVIRHIREKLSCRSCDTVIAAPAPDHAIARGRAGAELLAHIVVSKYDDHLPLYRQGEIFARERVNLETSTLSGWVGATSAALAPLIDALAADLMASDTLHVDDTPGVEAACWAHVRRKFFDVHAANGSPIAKEALDRIGKLYEIERQIQGLVPDHRRRERQKRSKPIANALAAWTDETRRKLSGKSELAAAFRYMRARWTALNRCFDDGRLALDNNPAERALRCVAIGRKNYLFAGSDAGGRRAAAMYSLIESAKLNGLNPQHYLADVLARIADHPARRIDELLPWNWQPIGVARAAA